MFLQSNPIAYKYTFTCIALKYWDNQSWGAKGVSEFEHMWDSLHPVLFPDPVSLSRCLTDFLVLLQVQS
jgi:hypothetical protein